jgi:O-antigen ligase
VFHAGHRERTRRLILSGVHVSTIAVSAYVLTVYLVSAIPGLSRLAHLGVAMILAALLFTAATSGVRLRLEPLPLLFWLFFLYAFASVLWSPVQGSGLVRGVSLLIDILGATLVWLALVNGVALKWVALWASVGASAQSASALSQFWTGDVQRAVGLTGNANELAIQLSLTAFLLLLLGRRAWTMQTLALLFIIIATITSGSRKMIFVWFTYLLLVWRWLSHGMRRSAMVAAAALLLLPLSMLLAIQQRDVWLEPIENLEVYQRLERALAGDDNSAAVRGRLLEGAVGVWQDSPLWGVGIDQYRFMSEHGLYSHNNYSELLANFGLIGFMLYYSIHLTLAIRAIHALRRGSRSSWLVLLFILLLLLMDVARVSYNDRLTWLLLAVFSFVTERAISATTAGRSSEGTSAPAI